MLQKLNLNPVWEWLAILQAGLRAAYINRDKTPYPDFFAQPDAEFASFESMADALCKEEV